jgi:hypothetical protein
MPISSPVSLILHSGIPMRLLENENELHLSTTLQIITIFMISGCYTSNVFRALCHFQALFLYSEAGCL